MTDKIRNFPEGLSPEDTIRLLSKDDDLCDVKVIRKALDHLFEIIDADPDIDASGQSTHTRVPY